MDWPQPPSPPCAPVPLGEEDRRAESEVEPRKMGGIKEVGFSFFLILTALPVIPSNKLD